MLYWKVVVNKKVVVTPENFLATKLGWTFRKMPTESSCISRRPMPGIRMTNFPQMLCKYYSRFRMKEMVQEKKKESNSKENR